MVAVDLEYRPQGAALQLFERRFPDNVIGETLIEGPAGTGKTRGVCEYENYLCEAYPRTRHLWIRKTLKSLRQSVLNTFEDDVLWPGHTAIPKNALRSHRDGYMYENGSQIVLGCMENINSYLSTEYDTIVFFEAKEGTLADHETLKTRLRNWKMPWQELIDDTNPGARQHYLNKRAASGLMQRLLSRHGDNPACRQSYIDNLALLTGARRANLYLGLWESEEGQVWENWDEAFHVINPSQVPEIRWAFGSVDWGWRHAGVFQVWGVDAERRLYRLAEVYKTGKLIDWWAQIACELYAEFKLRVIVCDPSKPEAIGAFNERLGPMVGRGTPPIARGANNQKKAGKDMGGLDLVRWALEKDAAGKAHMYFVRDALRHGRDELLASEGKVCISEDEIPGYVWHKNEEGKPIKEEPDDLCQQDGCDATRYGANFAWLRDLSDLPKAPRSAPGTYGHETGYDDWLDKARAWDQAHGLTPAI